MNDMLKRLLSFTLALVMVFGMMPAEALASELGNDEPTVTPTEAPTEVVTEAPATEHSHAHEGAVTTAATCEAEGVMTYTCSCGDTYTEAIAALGHTYVDGFCACGAEDPDWTPADGGTDGDVPEETTEAPAHTHAHEGVVTTEATCTEDGVKTFTCPCGDSYTEAIAATGHAYEDGVCGVCGAADPDYEEKPELSGETRKIYYYNVESWDEVWAAWSFDEDGFDDVAHPGEELSSNTELEDVYVIKVPVEADEVLFSDGIEVTEELLERERLAGISVTHEIEVRLAEDRYYDLYQNGAWANYAQTVKALEETEPETEVPAEHTCSYEGTVTKEATCEEAGEMIYACTCGESNTEVMPALGHDYAEGKCTRCGAADPVAEVQAMIEALPTSFATQAEVDNFWDVTAADLDAAIEALTAEQQEQLDTARYDAAIDAAAAFANPEFNDWTSWAASNPTWDATATNPYIINVGPGEAGSITKSQLYELLKEKYPNVYEGVSNGGYKYDDTQIRESSANDTSANLVAETEYTVQRAYRSGWSVKWQTEEIKFKVVEASSKDVLTLKAANADGKYVVKVNLTTYDGLRTAIITAAVASINDGTVNNSEAVVTFNHKLSASITDWDGTDEDLVLSDETLDEFIASENKTWIKISYGNADAKEITIDLQNTLTETSITLNAATMSMSNLANPIAVSDALEEMGFAVMAGDAELTKDPTAVTVSMRRNYRIVTEIDEPGTYEITVSFAATATHMTSTKSANLTVNDARNASSITVKAGEAEYYTGMDMTEGKLNIFNAIYGESTPKLTVNDVTVQVKGGLGTWQDVTTTAGWLAITGAGMDGNVDARIVFAGNGTYKGDTSESVSVKLIDGRKEVSVTTPVEITFAEEGMLDALKTAIAAEPAGVKYYDGTTELTTDELVVKMARENPDGATVSIIFDGNDEYKPSTVLTGVKSVSVTFTDIYYDVPVTGGTVNNGDTSVRVNYGGTAEVAVDTAIGYNKTLTVDNGTLTEGVLSDVKHNTTLTVTSTPIEYDVTWVVDGEETTTKVAFDSAPVFDADSEKDGVQNPAKDATAQYTYTFAGWDAGEDGVVDYAADELPVLNVDNGYQNVKYTAVFTPTVNQYTVKFVDGNDETVSEEKYDYGTTAADIVVPQTATKNDKVDDNGNVMATYAFKGWGEIADVTDDATYTATFDEVAKKYTITFVSHDGEEELSVAYGVVPTVHPDYKVPADYEEGDTHFTFAGWDANGDDEIDTVTAVTGDATYAAVYTDAQIFEVTFDANGGKLTEDNVKRVVDGEKVAALEVSYEGYRFDGWYLTGEDGELEEEAYDFTTPVTADITLTAKWVEQVTVTFDVEGIDDQVIDINTKATKPADPDKEYAIFGGWFNGETEFNFDEAVAENVALTAKWIADVNDNNVLDENETVTITVITEEDGVGGEVTVSGATEIGDGKYVYDSLKGAQVSVVAKPVIEDGSSRSYVSGIKVDDEPIALKYNEDYSVTYEFMVEGSEIATAADLPKTVEITFTDCGFIYDEDGQMRFYVGMEDPEYETLYNAVITSPEYVEGAVTAKYLARPAATYQMQVPVLFQYTIPLINYEIKIGGNTVDIDLDDAWLDVGEPFKTLTPEELQKQYDTEIQKIKDKIAAIDLTDITWSNAWEKVQQFAAIREELNTLIETMKNEATYLGYHQFGASSLVDENGNTQEILQIIYEIDSMHLQDDEVTVTLVDDRIATTITGGNLTFEYDEFTDETIMEALVLTDANGNVVEGELTKFVDLAGTEVGSRTYTVNYAGSWDYKPATAEFTLTVIKAPSNTNVENQTVTYGSSYSAAPVITNKHGKAISVDTIEFFVGLDVADLDVDGDGVKGLEGRMQLILTDELQTILSMVGLTEGVELNISDLISALTNTGLLEQWGVTGEMVEVLKNVLNSINSVVETNNLMITIGGDYPTDIGVYLQGAVTVDKNYETSFDMGYLIIKPKVTEHKLEWNEPALTNAVVTLPVFNSMDKGAHAVEAEDYEASYLILGINDETGNIYTTDIYGNIKLNIWSDPNEIKDNGAYVQIAYGIDWGNEFAYAMPIIRSFAVVPALYDVQLVGVTGEPNDELLKTFNNQPQGFSVIVKDNKGNVIYSDHYQNVVALRENAQLVVNYVGVQTNGQPYNSNEKPVHAGVYAATAVYMEFNDGQMLDISNLDVEDLYELFDLADIGADMGLLVIEPAESTINVEDKIVAWDGTHYKFSDQVLATSVAAENLNPDKTIISAGINTDGDFSENGWAAVGGTVNVDFPRWIDELIAQYAPSVVEGISVKEFSDKLVSKLPSIAAKLEELGATNEMLHSLTNAVTSVAGALENVPENVKLSFNDDAYASSVGAYVIIGIVTDSDHIPSVDAGLLVIAPDVNPVELKWNYEDEDNIWTRELLKFVDLKATAYSAVTGERNEAATDMITHKFIGIDKKGNLIVKDTRNADELPNGAYFELAYIKLDVDGAMTVSNLIAREILLVPGTVEVAFVDAPENNIWNHIFDNTPKAVKVVVTNNGKVVEPKAGELTVTYTGIQTNGKIYRSTEAPVHAGAYTVAAEYVEYTAGGSLANIGAAAGFITIAPAEATINVADSMIVDFQSGKSYDLEETMVTVGSAVPNLKPDTTIISAQINTDGDFSENGWAAVNGNVNVDFPRWMDELLAEQVPGVKDGITAAELKEKLTAKLPGILSKLEDLGATNEIINSLNNLVGNLNKVLAQIPDNMTLTFKDDVVVSSVGAYAVAAIVTDSDHIPAADAGVLVILPEVDVVDLKWNHEDANNIWTRELLEEFDLWAKAYDKESGELDAGATAVIHYQFIGMDKNGSLLVIDTNDANDLPNGVYTELAYIELEIDGHMYISDLIARTVIIVPNAAEVKFVDVNGNNARRFVFDNTQMSMDVTVALNGEVITPAAGTLNFTYNGIQTNGKTYNSTTAPVHAGIYTVMAEYADYTEGGSLAHYGAAAGIMAIEPAASTMDVTGGTVTYDGEGHTATVVATGSGVTEPDYTLISGGAYVSGDINEVGVDAFHGNVNIDFPAWLDKALAEHEFKTEGVDTAYLTDFISSYRDDVLALIPVEALVKLGVAEEEINAYIAKLNGYIDELLAVLEKLPAGVALTFNDDVTYTEPGYYFFYGIVTDSDHYPSADTGLLVIEKKEILFDLLDTKVTWNGKGQMVDLNNPENADFVTVVIDRKNNTINIILDEDAQYALNAVAKLLGVEFDGDVQMSTILNKYNGKEVAAAIVELINEAQKLELPEEIRKVLDAVKAELETLPTSGTITVNGELPTELGVYEVYAISYSQHFKTTAAEAELEIVPVRVEVILNEVSKVYGEEDPELTYTVKYYDHEGNEMTGVDANITVQISREAGEDVGTYAITGTVTLGDNIHFELIKQPVDSKFTITKATDNTWITEPGIEGWTYGETAKTPVGEAKYGEIKVEYRPADDPDAPFTTTVPTDAGDYIVRFTVEGTDNYNGITVEKELTIAKAASKITEEPKAVENLVYDGENHALITAGVAEGGKLVYSLSENGPFSEEIPVGKEAGTYTVYYKVAGDNNHNDSEVKSITVKIKEDHTGEYPIDMSAFANQYTIKPGATVEIDGVPYTLDEDCIAWVKNTDAKIVTTYKYHEGNTANETYPTNMYVWYLTTEDTDKDQKMDKYNAERIPELDNLFEYNGTSIRVGAAKNGIRFFTSMNPSTRTALQNGTLINTSVLKGAKMVRAGTVFKKNPEVQVTLENGVSSDVYGGKAGSNFRVFGTYSGRNWFTGMLVGLDTDAETVTAGIAARPYAQLQIGDETVVIYGGQIQRSIYYVACQNQDTFAQGSSYDQFVEGLIAKGNSIRGEG